MSREYSRLDYPQNSSNYVLIKNKYAFNQSKQAITFYVALEYSNQTQETAYGYRINHCINDGCRMGQWY